MASALRPLLLLVVLSNVGFVWLTGALAPLPTAALVALTLAAPWLQQLQGRRGYRLLWNASVVLIFALLMQHALSTGLLHMLEDGLLLAALCQVHLLNNLGPRQRPDLLFFNSFLIAFVTSFFCQDLGWSLAFLAYVLAVVPGLQLYVALPRRGPPAPGVVRAVLRDGLARTLAALLVTGLVFALWPRDFRRQGWLQDHLDLSRLTGMQTGFSDELRLDRAGIASTSERVVLRIVPQHGHAGEVPTHWRGATLVDFDGSAWTGDADGRLAATRTDEPWQPRGGRSWRRQLPLRGGALQVRVIDGELDRVLLPPSAAEFELSSRMAAGVEPHADGTVSWRRELVRQRHLAPGYQVRCGELERQRPLPVDELAQRRLLQLGPLQLPPPLLALARELRLPRGAAPAQIAETTRQWLAGHRRYALPGSPDAASSLDEFVLGHGGGHCELFAATLALLLRAQGVPCRIVTGYLAHEWDAARGEVVVRRRDAHAWVEALLPQRGWVTCDATPAAGSEPAELVVGDSWWAAAKAQLRSWWAAVTGFDAERRSRLWQGLQQLPAAVAAALAARPLATAAVAALLLLAAVLWRRRRRSAAAGVNELRRALRRAGLRLLPGETPRELLGRAAARLLPPQRLAALAAAAAAHEAARYAEAGRR